LPPLRKDLVLVRHVPGECAAERARIDAGLFEQFAVRGAREILVLIAASGHRLPMLWVVGALEQQHVQVRRMHEHQHRDRLLVTHGGLGLPRRAVS